MSTSHQIKFTYLLNLEGLIKWFIYAWTIMFSKGFKCIKMLWGMILKYGNHNNKTLSFIVYETIRTKVIWNVILHFIKVLRNNPPQSCIVCLEHHYWVLTGFISPILMYSFNSRLKLLGKWWILNCYWIA